MTDQVTTAVLVALAGGLGGFLGAGFSAWTARGSTERTHRREQQRQDAHSIGPVLDYLVDSDPQRMILNASDDSETRNKEIADLVERRDKVRGGVLVMAVGHPDPSVSIAARELSVALYNALSSAVWAIRVDRDEFNDASAPEVAKRDHAAAQSAAEKVLTAALTYGAADRRSKRRIIRAVDREIGSVRQSM